MLTTRHNKHIIPYVTYYIDYSSQHTNIKRPNQEMSHERYTHIYKLCINQVLYNINSTPIVGDKY